MAKEVVFLPRMVWVLCFSILMPCWGCHQDERSSLLDFKHGLNFTRSREFQLSTLESWRGFNCCAWEGVGCHPRTGHVLSLNLSLGSSDYSTVRYWSEIRGGLFQLMHLEYLDLSENEFYPPLPIPSDFHKLTRLRYLNLADCKFIGKIPREIGNMSNLKFLDLSWNPNLESSKLGEWLTHLKGLEHLALNGMNLSMSSDSWGKDIVSLPSLKTLVMFRCRLFGEIPSSIANLSHLEELDLSDNSLIGKIPPLRWPLSLSYLYLSGNNLKGSIPSSLNGLSKLSLLYLRFNQLNGSIPSILGNLSSLASLDLSSNSLSGTIPTSLAKLSKLTYLDLSSNSLSGTIPTSLAKLSKLTYLDLSSNSLSGTIPTSLVKLTRLTSLFLSNNQLSGTYWVSLVDNFPKIQVFYLSQNLLTVKVHATYIPKFQLRELGLRSCNMEGDFPGFISTQYSLDHLDLSQNSLTGNIPDWLWDFTPLYHLNLSSNQFVGHFPSKFIGFQNNFVEASIIDLHKNKLQGNVPLPQQNVLFLDLSDNLFDGCIPIGIGKHGQALRFLSLANNNLSSVIPLSVGEFKDLEFLDLSNNKLSGNIPTSLNNCSKLSILNLEKNDFKGEMPNVFGNMISLETLKLGDNGLKGCIPSSLANCNSLEILDMRNNNMHGSIPNWIESLQSLRILVLKSNKFVGKIPSELANLQNLQILDISNNKFSGVVPDNFMNLSAMVNQSEDTNILEYTNGVIYVDQLVIMNKGQAMVFERSLRLVKCLDLSNNNLSGGIPWDIESLKGLIILNVSRNHFSGEIPKSLGSMVWLESLDLSQNELSGVIPIEMEHLTYLSYLDVSNNNLSGIIPQGGQMLTFDISSFYNNSGLCGLQINISCSGNHPASSNNGEENEEEWEEDIWWYVAIGLSFAFGFSVVIWVLCFYNSWSAKCLGVMDGIIDYLFQTLRGKLYSTR